MKKTDKPVKTVLCASVLGAISVLAGCGGGDDTVAVNNTNPGSATVTYTGVVAASAYVPGSATGDPTLKAGYYSGATVFIDANGNGVRDNGETSTTTDANGRFTLPNKATGQIVADIPTTATNTATGAKVAGHLILRASADQIADQGAANIVISPMSSEVQRLVEANNSSYATEKANLTTRLSGPMTTDAGATGSVTLSGANVLADVNSLTGVQQYAVLQADNSLTNRYTYATAKFDRKDLYPDALAVPGNDPRLSAVSSQINLTGGIAPVIPADKRTPITFAQAQQAAFNLEGVPAYDNIFVIVEENQSAGAIIGNSYAPYMNALLSQYNQLTTYYSTGNPSEPNYTAMGGGDDNGITDDNWWGCGAYGSNALQDVALSATTASDGQPIAATGATPALDSSHLAGFSTTAGNSCSTTPTSGTNHNIPGDNLFTLLNKAGLTIRTYSESIAPGQDARADSQADAAVVGAYSGSYASDDILAAAGVSAATASPALTGGVLTGTAGGTPLMQGLYKVKHGPSIAFQNARLLPEFRADNRTIFGSQYTDATYKLSTTNAPASNWNFDQFSTDVSTGDVGNINFIVPDQCDDMHGVGGDSSCQQNNSTGQAPGTTRADIYLQRIVTTIRNSALWKNPQKRVAIVVVYDEGEGSSTACCGWNPSLTSNDQPYTVTQNANGGYTLTANTASPSGYDAGNHGHGQSIFGIVTNQQDLGKQAKGLIDTDAYSHFSLVRTLQDMFQIADPANEATYLNRAKYTEYFIQQNIANLPEFAGSADTHFDGVRPINHAYVIPAGYQQKLNLTADFTNKGNTGAAAGITAVQTGPDATQANLWGAAR
jgi:hypothetical protein